MDTRLKSACAGVLLAISASVSAAGDPVGYVFAPDTPIRANEINANFQELADRIVSSGSVSDPTGKLYIFHIGDLVTVVAGRNYYTTQCAAVDPDSAVCSIERIHAAIAGKGIVYAPDFAGGWIDAVNYASCASMNTVSSSYYGSYIYSSGRIVTGASDADTSGKRCDNSGYIVCCK